MRTKEEIIKALNIIQEVCNETDICYKCPLSDNRDGCVLQNMSPIDWDIKTSEDVWRAFYD